MPGPFDNLGCEVLEFFQYLAGDCNSAFVTVQRVDPDTGDVLQTAESVTAMRPVVTPGNATAAEGQVGLVRGEIWLVVEGMEFTPKPADVIVEENAAWIIDKDGFDLIGFGSPIMAKCPVVKKR